MPQSDFLRGIEKAGDRLRLAQAALERAQRLAEQKDMAGAFGTTFAFAADIEKLALLARALPAYTGHPKAAELTDSLLEDLIPVELGFTEEGWFCLRIPALLPKKGSGSPSYLRDFLYPAMRRFFAGKLPVAYQDCVLIFRHIYDRRRPERAYRDHDNIEVNLVADIVALYLLADDAPLRCAHYYCSAAGEKDRTEVYVVPIDQLPAWLIAAKGDALEGVTLLENHP
ncbi:hypothetical protein SDC9_87028 [bioreactor metagenome]|uniref:Uncharacterized protein n=1 Tax=bioreactor metagenome TaxID=1076179 RepID=A0A644ZJ77_9ZZZZ